MNGIASVTGAVPAAEPQEGMVEKRNSLSRSGARFSAGRRVTPASTAAAAATGTTGTPPPSRHQHTGSGQLEAQQQSPKPAQHGVTLVDAPMDY
jgi:hypothetical protein